jgi:PKD repeat protein
MHLRNTCLKVCAAVVFATMLLALTLQTPRVSAQSGAMISISPNLTSATIGENFTVTLSVINLNQQLYSWEADLKFNGTIANCTSVWVPSDNVFAGHTCDVIGPASGTDGADNLSYLQYGNTLLGPTDYASVTSGILYQANFTVKAFGSTNIVIATPDEPILVGKQGWNTFYSLLVGPLLTGLPEYPYTASRGCSVGKSPVARFQIIVPTINNASKLIVKGNVPAGINYVNLYEGYTDTFNASDSYETGGYIAHYVWNFGDGNVTQDIVNTTDPVVRHVYNATGTYTVTLVVYDNGTPPLASRQASDTVVVGLILQLYNWSPLLYAVILLICAAVVFYGARGVQRAVRRRAERKRKLLSTKPPTTPVPEPLKV